MHSHQSKIDFLKKVFPTHKIGKNNEVIVRCPYCGDPRKPKKLKMNISVEKGIFHCWVCDQKGASIPRMLRKASPNAARAWVKKFGEKTRVSEKEYTIQSVELPKDFRLVMNSLHLPEAKRAYRYCVARGMTDDMIWRYRIGISDTQKWRIIIPSFDETGELNYWTARRVDDDPNWRYVNAEAERGEVIFNEIDIDWSAPEITLVEGPFDLIKCTNRNATCLLGSWLSSKSQLFVKLIHYPERIILALDKDAQSKQDKIAELLMSYGKEVYYVDPPRKKVDNIIEDLDWGDLDPNEVEKLMSETYQYDSYSKLDRKISTL
jgi:DNA primase